MGAGFGVRRRQGRADAEQPGEPRLPPGALQGGEHSQHQGEAQLMPLEGKDAAAVLQQLLAALKRVEPKADGRARLFSAHRANTRFARNEVTTSGESDEASVSLYAALGKRHAVVSSNQTDASSLSALAQRVVA